MNRHVTRLAAALLAGCATGVFAAEPAAAGGDGSRVVCFAEKQTGSNLRKKVCMSEAERERRRKEDQEALANLKQGSSARSSSNKDTGIFR